jgi:endonuclease/exonuclease/phosphatase family metal-dependent hydrolase
LPFIFWGLLSLLCPPLGWFLLNRALSPWRALRLQKTALPEGPRRDFAGRLRIGAYNIAHGRGAFSNSWRSLRKETILEQVKKIAQLLRDANLDIVVLNEVDFDSVWFGHINQAELIARETGFFFWAEQRNIDVALPFARIRYGNVILSRYPILTARRLPFVGHHVLETIFLGKKQGLLCTLELSGAHRLRVLAVHLEHRQEARRLRTAQMMEAVRLASAVPLIAAGDFNSTPATFPQATPDDQGRTALSWLLARGAYQTLPTATPGRVDMTFWSIKPSRVIDWILVPAGWKILSKEVMGGELSDHRAVVMEVEVGEEIEGRNSG